MYSPSAAVALGSGCGCVDRSKHRFISSAKGKNVDLNAFNRIESFVVERQSFKNVFLGDCVSLFRLKELAVSEHYEFCLETTLRLVGKWNNGPLMVDFMRVLAKCASHRLLLPLALSLGLQVEKIGLREGRPELLCEALWVLGHWPPPSLLADARLDRDVIVVGDSENSGRNSVVELCHRLSREVVERKSSLTRDRLAKSAKAAATAVRLLTVTSSPPLYSSLSPLSASHIGLLKSVRDLDRSVRRRQASLSGKHERRVGGLSGIEALAMLESLRCGGQRQYDSNANNKSTNRDSYFSTQEAHYEWLADIRAAILWNRDKLSASNLAKVSIHLAQHGILGFYHMQALLRSFNEKMAISQWIGTEDDDQVLLRRRLGITMVFACAIAGAESEEIRETLSNCTKLVAKSLVSAPLSDIELLRMSWSLIFFNRDEDGDLLRDTLTLFTTDIRKKFSRTVASLRLAHCVASAKSTLSLTPPKEVMLNSSIANNENTAVLDDAWEELAVAEKKAFQRIPYYKQIVEKLGGLQNISAASLEKENTQFAYPSSCPPNTTTFLLQQQKGRDLWHQNVRLGPFYVPFYSPSLKCALDIDSSSTFGHALLMKKRLIDDTFAKQNLRYAVVTPAMLMESSAKLLRWPPTFMTPAKIVDLLERAIIR